MLRYVKKSVVAAFICTFCLLAIGFLCIYMYVNSYNKKCLVYEITENCDSDINITMTSSKSWIDDVVTGKVGAQYDGVVENNGKYSVENWEIVVHLPVDARVDSLWNGNYTQEGRDIHITPMDYNCLIDKKSDDTFGFVLISDDVLDITDFTYYCHYRICMKEMPIFYILFTLAVFWVLALLWYVVLQMRLLGYKLRQEHDENIIVQTMNTFTGFIDAKDPYTNGHSGRVAEYVKELALRMKLSEEQVRNCYYVALMHDCGKIGVPNEILNKPGKLNPDEKLIMNKHTEIGAGILENFTAIPDVSDGALHHHERYDGNGYPSGLKGEEISIISRIICVADSFDAMNSDRCYRNHLVKDEIIRELKENAGTQFDPYVVKHMIDMINEGVVSVDTGDL